MPKPGEDLTQEQVGKITNLKKYANDIADVTIEKGWHQGPATGGQFEGWAMDAKSGYSDGYPLYAGISINGKKLHVYWLPKTEEMKLAGPGEDPRNT